MALDPVCGSFHLYWKNKQNRMKNKNNIIQWCFFSLSFGKMYIHQQFFQYSIRFNENGENECNWKKKKQCKNQCESIDIFGTIEFDPLFLLIELNIGTKIYSAHKTALPMKKKPHAHFN